MSIKVTETSLLTAVKHFIQAVAQATAIACDTAKEEDLEKYVVLATAAVSFINAAQHTMSTSALRSILTAWVEVASDEEIGSTIGKTLSVGFEDYEIDILAELMEPHIYEIAELPRLDRVRAQEDKAMSEDREWFNEQFPSRNN